MGSRAVWAALFLLVFRHPILGAGNPLTAGDTTDALTARQELARIYASDDFAVKTFGSVQWGSDGRTYTTLEPTASDPLAVDIVEYTISTGKSQIFLPATELLVAGSKTPVKIESYACTKDRQRVLIFTNSKPVWRQNTRGDYWLFDGESKRLQKLGGDAASSSLMFAKFSPDGNRVAYVRANNIFVEDLQTKKIVRLTNDGSDTTINGTADWVYEEEFDLRDGFRWSPDGSKIAYWQFDTTNVGRFTLLYNLGNPREVVTSIPYPELGRYPVSLEIPYPLAGTANSAARVGVVSADGGATTWMKVPGDPRNNYIARMDWAANSRELLLQHLNRAQNRNDILLANAQTGAVDQVYSDQDSAWVDVMDDLRWLKGGQEFLLLSERDGWRHEYAISRNGSHARLITTGPLDVIEVKAVDENEGWLYFIASPENATQRYLFRTRLDGSGSAERVTPFATPGTHAYDISPDSHSAVHTYSRFDLPPIVDLVQLPDHKPIRPIEDNSKLRANASGLISTPVEFLRVDVGAGVFLDGWLIKPPKFDPTKRYPLLIYVYGEPWGQTVLDSWEDGRSFWHFGLFHRAVANDGYIVASFDNRGTPAPKGRNWRKVVHNAVGPLAYAEQAAALRQLERDRSYIDPDRVAVWRWSGGGTSTLNLMFRYPDLYKVGMAIAPVPDQRLYDSIYQERYMGLPQENVDGYRESSAINFAEGLHGRLLLVHSSSDDNVHYQGSELLINRLIELDKPFDFMEYPARTHELPEGPRTRLHLHNLLLRYLEEHLPPTIPESR
jgi:dipeptidyl-peptidase 4